MRRIGLKDWYYKIEDKWFGAIDSLNRKGLPSYKLIDPLEKRGIPSLPVYVAILIIILFLAFPYLPGITIDTEEYTETSFQIVDKNEHSSAIEGATVTLEIAEEVETQLVTDETGRVHPEVKRGETYTIKAEKDGCGATSKSYTIPIEEDPEEKKLSLECELITDPNEVLLHFNPDDIGHVEYHKLEDGVPIETGLECGDSTGGCVATISLEEEYEYEFETENHISENTYTTDELKQIEEAGLTIPMQHHYQAYDGSVEVTVEDIDTGEPTPGIDIQLIYPETHAVYKEGTTEDTAGMKGKVLFEGLEIGTEFRVKTLAGPSSVHSITDEVYEVTEDTTITINTETEFETTIQVTEATGASLEGATVKVLDEKETIGTQTTDVDGEAVFQLPDGDYKAVAFKPGYREDVIDYLTVGEEHTANLENLPEEETANLNTVIHSEPDLTDGNRAIKPSVGEATVTLMRNPTTPVSNPIETSSGGIAFFHDRAGGNYCLKVEWEGEKYTCPSETQFEAYPPVEDNVWDFYLDPPRYPLKIDVTDTAGTPLAGAEIEVNWERGNKSYTKEGETDSLGLEEFDIIAGDRVDVTATKEIEGIPISRTRRITMDRKEDLEFTLDTTPPHMSQVTIKAVDDEDERPLQNAPIKLVNPENPNITIQNAYREEYIEGTTDEEGSISFGELKVGEEFKVKAEASNQNLHFISEENYTVKETNKEIIFPVKQGANTTITVTDRGGNELENAVLMVDNGETAENVFTDRNGEATIQLEREEEHKVTASKPNYHYTTETIIGGVDQTIEIEEIPEGEVEDEQIWIYTDPGGTPGNREIEVTYAKVTLTRDGEKLRTKETTSVPMVEFNDLEEGGNYGVDIEWKGETYSDSFTPNVEPSTYIDVSPAPTNSLIARIVGENTEPIEGVAIETIWPHDEEEPEEGEIYERGPEYTRSGQLIDGEIEGGWTPPLENIMDGDRVRVKADLEDEIHSIVKNIDKDLTKITIGEDGEEIDPHIGLINITRATNNSKGGFEDLSIAPVRYNAEFEMDLTGPEWENVVFKLNKSPKVEIDPEEVQNWPFSNPDRTISKSPDERQIKINLTSEDINDNTVAFDLPLKIDPRLGGESTTLNFETEWYHEEVSFSKADEREITIAKGEGTKENGFYVERAIKEDNEWKSPTPIQKVDPDEDISIRYIVTRLDEEPFEGDIRLEINEPADFTGPTKTIREEDIKLEQLESVEIERETISSMSGARITVEGEAIPLQNENIHLGNISYRNEGNTSVYVYNPKMIHELENELTIRIKSKAGETISGTNLKRIKDNSKITGEGLAGECDEIQLSNAEKITRYDLKVELDENCHLGKPGKDINIELSGTEIKDTTETFTIQESALFPEGKGDEYDYRIVNDGENECPIPLNAEPHDPKDLGYEEATPMVKRFAERQLGEEPRYCKDEEGKRSGIRIPYTGDVEIVIDEDNTELIGEERFIDWEKSSEQLSFRTLENYTSNAENDIKISLIARNQEEPEIKRTNELIIRAQIEHLSISDVTANLFYPDTLEKYGEDETIGATQCGVNYCNLDQLLEYIIRRTADQSSAFFPGRLAGHTPLEGVSSAEIEDTIDHMDTMANTKIELGDSEIGEVKENAKDISQANYIYIDDAELPRMGINGISVDSGEVENETGAKTNYYHIRFMQEDISRNPLKYHLPGRMRLHMPQQVNTGDERDTRTPIYIDDSIEDNDFKENISETIEKAWNADVETDEYSFESYHHGIRVGICNVSYEAQIDELDDPMRENCRKVAERTDNLPRSMIFKEVPDEHGENKINIIGSSKEGLEDLVDRFEKSFGEGVTGALQIIKPGSPEKGHLTLAPNDINYYAWDGTDESKTWLRDDDAEGDRNPILNEIEIQGGQVRGVSKQDMETKLQKELSEYSNVSWIIMRCDTREKPLSRCGPDPGEGVPEHTPIQILQLADVFHEDMRIPEGGIFFTQDMAQRIGEGEQFNENEEVQEDDVYLGGANIVIVTEEETDQDIYELIKTRRDKWIWG